MKIITMKDCGYCDKAKELLTELNLEYEEYPAKDMILRLMPLAGFSTVPQIWDDNWNYIGGYTQLKKYLSVTKGTHVNALH